MWVTIFDWMLADDEPPAPRVGSVLRAAGVRVRGALTTTAGATPTDVVQVSPGQGLTPPQPVVYALTGFVGPARNVWMAGGNRMERNVHAGAEFSLLVGTAHFVAWVNTTASAVPKGSRVTVTGGLELLAEHDWEDWQPVNRTDWTVAGVIDLPGGGLVADLEPR